MTVALDGKRLLQDLDSLARIGASLNGGVNRIAYTPADQKARRWVESRMRELGLELRTDQAGNSIGVYQGQVAQLPSYRAGFPHRYRA